MSPELVIGAVALVGVVVYVALFIRQLRTWPSKGFMFFWRDLNEGYDRSDVVRDVIEGLTGYLGSERRIDIDEVVKSLNKPTVTKQALSEVLRLMESEGHGKRIHDSFVLNKPMWEVRYFAAKDYELRILTR